MTAGREPIAGNVPEISVSEAWQRLTTVGDDPAPVLIDVREVWEYQSGHAQGAINIPLSQFRQRFTEVPTGGEVLFICQVGARSMQAAKFVRAQGIAHSVNVGGGTDAWQMRGLPME